MGRLQEALAVPRATALVLAHLGFERPEAARRFLAAPIEDLSDPADLPDADAAAARLREAVANEEHIRVFGDYDCDGLTATALLVGVLQRMDARVDFHIPSRLKEGYGLSVKAVERAATDGVDLLITVDCGITAHAQVQRARELGLDIIITDHHEPAASLPPAVAVVDPKRKDSHYPFPELAGVGVIYQLLSHAFGDRLDLAIERDLVAVGTVADVAPLVGDNRILVRAGLQVLRERPRTGLRALAEAAGLEIAAVDADHLAMILGPRLNAPGRIGDATPLLELLLTGEPARAEGIARACEKANRRRRGLQDAVVEGVERLGRANGRFSGRGFLVLFDPEWHPGVLGPAASRVAEEYRRPVLLLAPGPDDATVYHGSGRSIADFDLLGALGAAGDLLERYGGHRAAAGASVRAENLADLSERLDAIGRRGLQPAQILPRLRLVGELGLSGVDRDAVDALAPLAPFGRGNPRPVFLARDVRVERARPVGDGEHHLMLDFADRGLQGIGFGLGPLWKSLQGRGSLDLAFTPELDRWKGRERVRLRLESVRPAGQGDAGTIVAALRRRWREARRGQPEGARLRAILEALRQLPDADAGAGGFFDPAGEAGREICTRLGLEREELVAALEVLAEAGVVAPMQRGEDRLWLLLPAADEPLELDASLRYRQGQEYTEQLRRAAADPEALTGESLASLLYGFRPGSSGVCTGVSDGEAEGTSRT